MPRKWHNYLRSIIGELIFRRAIKRFIQNPELCLDPGSRLLHHLVYGWGNSWSAQHEYLAACLEAALQSEGPILECGSGLSTVLLGAIADCKGYKLYSFENSSQWADKVIRALEVYGIGNVVVSVSPLRDYGGYSWYENNLNQMPEFFPLVICDGPPSVTPGGRYGLVPIMKEYFTPDVQIFLDDGLREEEQKHAKLWEKELSCQSFICGSEKPYIVIKKKP